MILADHCVYSTTIRFLESLGISVAPLRSLIDPAVSDDRVLALAQERDLVLLTNDLDFSNILVYPPALSAGIIVLRITAGSEHQVHAVLRNVVSRSREDFRGKLFVVDARKYRIRA